MIEVKLSEGKGRGVFATQDIPAYQIIEVADVLFVPEGVMEDYVYELDDRVFLALGVGSLFNHGKANVDHSFIAGDIPKIIYYTTRNVVDGEELLIN